MQFFIKLSFNFISRRGRKKFKTWSRRQSQYNYHCHERKNERTRDRSPWNFRIDQVSFIQVEMRKETELLYNFFATSSSILIYAKKQGAAVEPSTFKKLPPRHLLSYESQRAKNFLKSPGKKTREIK